MRVHSGFFDLLEKRELIKKDGNRYTYIDLNGEIHKYYRKEWNSNINGIMDLVMKEFEAKTKLVKPATVDSEEPMPQPTEIKETTKDE